MAASWDFFMAVDSGQGATQSLPRGAAASTFAAVASLAIRLRRTALSARVRTGPS